ncbi:MAG: HYR domain-containing protein [Acidobacteriota bacterium]
MTSGSTFPLGTTTVTCTATDASGNTATCSFTVTVFNACLQDDSNPSLVVVFNSQTGEYRFCCGGTIFTGTGTVRVRGCVVTIQDNAPGRRVRITLEGSVNRGSASLESPPGTLTCLISDRNTTDNNCACP